MLHKVVNFMSVLCFQLVYLPLGPKRKENPFMLVVNLSNIRIVNLTQVTFLHRVNCMNGTSSSVQQNMTSDPG